MKLNVLKGWVTVLALASATSAFAAHSVPVSVKDGDTTMKGDLYLPNNAKGSLPLVVVVHEWWGKSDYPAMRGKKIADELGYAALAVDLYGGGKSTDDAKEAGELATPFYKNPEMGVARLKEFISAAPAAAKEAGATLDMGNVAAIGYCFGGTQVLNLARADQMPEGVNLKGVVTFHGGLASSMKASSPIKPKLLVLHGADDQFVKPDEVKAFKAEMKKDKANMKFIAYPGATHAFSNPKATEMGKKNNIPVAYNEKADRASWKEMKAFTKKLFGK
jgi:dienelactone hydrolase